MLAPGEMIDIWVVEKALGAGGMGSVYRCHNRRAKRILAAVKMLDPSIRRFPGAEARFVREAEILFALDHPNIVKVRNIRVDRDPPYIEMEFIRGVRLEDHLAQGPLDLKQCASLIRQLFDALGYLHRKGVRHRDVKPANLLVQENGTLKLVDFGLAMEADATRITQGGMAFGTVSYAPPEWIRPELIVPQAWDAYSAGVVAWEILTGRTAFPSTPSGDPRQQAMQVIIGKQGHAPLDPGAAVGEGLRRAVLRLTDADPDKRLTDLDEALRMLGGSPGLVPIAGAGATVPPAGPSGGNVTPHTWHDEQPPAPLPHRSNPILTTFDEGDLPRELQPQSGSLDPLDSDRETSARPVRSFGALGLAVLATACLGLATAYLWTRAPSSEPAQPPSTARSLAVSVAGLPSETSYTVGIDGVPAPQRDGGLSRFSEVPIGEQAIYLIVGDECDPVTCPGDTCPSWCMITEHPLTVLEGAGEQAVSVVGRPPKARPVTVSVADEVGFVTRPPSELADGRATPGKYEVLAYAGECPEDPWTCLTEECSDCRISTLDWIMPATAEVQPLVIPLEPEVPQERAPAPRRRSSLVTHGEFASWLGTHPEWQREAAIARKQADAGYLKGWSGTTPPVGMAGKPVVNVSWYAADAFCFERGGLADVEAPPLTWTAGPMIELRQSGGGVAWRSSDGTPSTQLNRNQTNSFAGVRCRR